MHHKNPQLLATKIFKVKIDPAPDVMKYIFQFKNSTSTYVQTQRPLSLSLCLSLTKDKNSLSRTKLYPVPCHKNIQTSTRKYENLQLIKVFQAIN